MAGIRNDTRGRAWSFYGDRKTGTVQGESLLEPRGFFKFVLANCRFDGGGSHRLRPQAEATIYWPNPTPDTRSLRRAVAPPRKRKVRDHSEADRKAKGQQKEIAGRARMSAKPHGPLLIAISINKQNMKIYDANGFFAETPISTGMRGHPTPMGVFSVIQKKSCTIPTSIAARRCPLCSGSRGRASPSTPACCRATRHRMAVSVCRWPLP